MKQRRQRDTGIGERLQKALARYSGPAAQLARDCDVSPAAVSRWFKGDVTVGLDAKNVFQLAHYCRINPKWLALGEGTIDGVGFSDPVLGAARAISPVEDEVLRAFSKLPHQLQTQVRALLGAMAEVTHRR